jgi:HTH-type transcriptional regulator / antitoxin HigA
MTRKRAADVFKNLPDRFEDLCTAIAFPRPIKDAVDYENVVGIVGRLMARKTLTEGQTEYLDALSTFVEKYEAQEFPLDPVSARDILQHLMQANDMSASDLSKLLGDDTRSLGTRLLSGERELSKAHIAKLCQHFTVSADLFLKKKK